jgi:ribokinase
MAKLCVVGSSNMDLVTYTATHPKIGETIRGRDFKLGFGGKGANQAVQAAKLGAASVAMVTRVGADTFGRSTLENYAACGVDCAHVKVCGDSDSGIPTGVAQITVDDRGRNSIIIVPGANDLLSVADVEAAHAAIAASRVVVCQLECALAATVAALRIARREGVFTIMNPAPAPTSTGNADDIELLRAMYELSDLFVPNETELEALTGLTVSTIDDAERAALRVCDGLALGAHGAAPKAVVVTLGERGCVYVRRGERSVYVPVRSKIDKVVDTTGAGDSFIGALAFFVASGVPVIHALEKAVVVATASVQRPGTQTSFPTRSDLPTDLFI